VLGWHISVYKRLNGGAAPATEDSPKGSRLAVWQAGLWVWGRRHTLPRSGFLSHRSFRSSNAARQSMRVNA
jgi:hypothetical protein